MASPRRVAARARGFRLREAPSAVEILLLARRRAEIEPQTLEARLAVNARLIDSFAGDFDDGVVLSASESNIIKLTVTNNAVAVVEEALSLTSNHGLTRANPLERHYRDVLCGRVHTPQDDATRLNAGRLVLGV